MKNLDLNAYGVSEMNHQEMVETDGGGLITGLIILGCIVVAAVATICNNTVIVNNGGSNDNKTTNTISTDSTGNGTTVKLQ